LRQRYGKGVVAELAGGRTDALAGDFEDADARQWIARAVVSAAKSHVAFGLTLKEALDAERRLAPQTERSDGKDWEW
jgi:type IV secretion system T-DNA border endonuclease VirD2